MESNNCKCDPPGSDADWFTWHGTLNVADYYLRVEEQKLFDGDPSLRPFLKKSNLIEKFNKATKHICFY